MNRDLDTFILAEQRVKISHFTQQGFDIEGIIHVGANDGEEIPFYQKMGVENIIAFEPLSKAFVKLMQNNKSKFSDGIKYAVKVALSDYDGRATFNITLGDGKGSSLLAPIEDHPEVVANWHGEQMVVDTEEVRVQRFDSWMKEPNGVKDLDKYDCLVLDTQGNELEVLKGFGEHLSAFKYLVVELSIVPCYDGEHPGQEVVEWLEGQGFVQDSPLQSHDDCMFIRKDIKATSDMVYRGLS